jgi:hypothetical protein
MTTTTWSRLFAKESRPLVPWQTLTAPKGVTLLKSLPNSRNPVPAASRSSVYATNGVTTPVLPCHPFVARCQSTWLGVVSTASTQTMWWQSVPTRFVAKHTHLQAPPVVGIFGPPPKAGDVGLVELISHRKPSLLPSTCSTTRTMLDRRPHPRGLPIMPHVALPTPTFTPNTRVIPCTLGMDAAEDELTLALVAMVGSTRPAISTA